MYKKNSPIWTTDLEALKQIVFDSKTRIEVLRKLGLRPFGSNYSRLDERVRNEKIDVSHFWNQSDTIVKINRARRQPIKNVLTEHSNYNKQRLKQRLLDENLLINKCNVCGIGPIWNGKKIVMILDHINGVHDDDRLENLQLVCPNCNSQLSTHCGRNRKAISNKKRCTDCAKVISNNRIRCRLCASIARRKVHNRPTKEQLLLDVSITNYQATARKYGVSNATIRKWLK